MSASYFVPGYDFLPPEGWIDRSIHTFVLDDGTATASLTVTRSAVPDGVQLRDFAGSELEKLSHALPDFKLIDRRDMVVASGAPELVECQCRTQHSTVDQLIAYLPDADGLVVFIGASPAPMPASIRSHILAAMASARPRSSRHVLMIEPAARVTDPVAHTQAATGFQLGSAVAGALDDHGLRGGNGGRHRSTGYWCGHRWRRGCRRGSRATGRPGQHGGVGAAAGGRGGDRGRHHSLRRRRLGPAEAGGSAWPRVISIRNGSCAKHADR